MTTIRELTDEQFSPGTTADGNRIEKALDNEQDLLNDIPLRNVGAYTSTVLHSSVTPATYQYLVTNKDPAFGADGPTYAYNTAPFIRSYNGTMERFIESGVEMNNPVRYKGVGTVSYKEGTSHNEGYWVWTNTYYFSKPAILQDLVIFGDYDLPMAYDGVNPAASQLRTKSYYNNDFVTRTNITDNRLDWTKYFQAIVAIDNNTDLGDTHARSQIINVWNSSARSHMKIPAGTATPAPPDTYLPDNGAAGRQFVHLYENPEVYYVVDGLGLRVENINIQIPQNSRVKIALVLPQDGPFKYNYPNNEGAGSTGVGCNQNIWTMQATVWEELNR